MVYLYAENTITFNTAINACGNATTFYTAVSACRKDALDRTSMMNMCTVKREVRENTIASNAAITRSLRLDLAKRTVKLETQGLDDIGCTDVAGVRQRLR
jgi:hypothetical protein